MNHKPTPMVSIITVNYRNPGITLELLRSISQLSFTDFEVIVVENSPVEDASDRYKEVFPPVRVEVSTENLGFAGGNNLGIQAAKGQFLYFINNDTEVTDESFLPLLEVMKDPNIGAASPKIKYFHHPDTIQFAGFSEINFMGRNKMLGKNEVDQGQHDSLKFIPYAHGAAMMVRREVVDKIGGMPEGYFLYYEELDWSAQIVEAGYKIVYVPRGVILHKESISVGKMSPLKIFYQTRNRIIFMRRNMSVLKQVGFFIYFFFVAFPKNVLMHFLKKETKLMHSYIKGTREAFSNKPSEFSI